MKPVEVGTAYNDHNCICTDGKGEVAPVLWYRLYSLLFIPPEREITLRICSHVFAVCRYRIERK